MKGSRSEFLRKLKKVLYASQWCAEDSSAPHRGPIRIPFWIIKPTLFSRLRSFLGWLNPVPKELRSMTKKKLRDTLKGLERQVEHREEDIEVWQKAYKELEKKYENLQQAVGDLVEKANLYCVKKDVYMPKEGW